MKIIDLKISSSGKAPGAANIKPLESIAISHGRQSPDRSVWYNGSLMTFLATGEDTHGQFALIEAVTRRGNVPPPHIHHREDEISYVLEGDVVVSVGDRYNQGEVRNNVLLTARCAPLVHNRIGAEPDAHSAHSRRAGRMVQGI